MEFPASKSFMVTPMPANKKKRGGGREVKRWLSVLMFLLRNDEDLNLDLTLKADHGRTL